MGLAEHEGRVAVVVEAEGLAEGPGVAVTARAEVGGVACERGRRRQCAAQRRVFRMAVQARGCIRVPLRVQRAVDEAGRIVSLEPWADGTTETVPGALWLPGFVDAHVHYPQTRMVGSASGPLLDWLSSTTFPEEARFAEDAYATAVAAEFCAALARSGTTAAAIFSSMSMSH